MIIGGVMVYGIEKKLFDYFYPMPMIKEKSAEIHVRPNNGERRMVTAAYGVFNSPGENIYVRNS